MTHGSLFAGIGGFDLACELNEIETAWQVEIDKNCQTVLRNHFKGVKLFDDIRTVGRHNLAPVDIITGGFPCQDVSVAGKRAGLAGERSGLWFEFARVIDELEPRGVVIENVPGLLSSNGGRDFAVIIQWLVKRGYGVVWRILDAQHFGVPQRRRRVFIIGSLGNGRASQVLFESEGLCRDTAPSRKVGEEIAYPIRANPSHSGDKGDGGLNTTLVARPLSTSNQRIDAETETLIIDNIAKARRNSDGAVIWEMPHASGVRRLTPTECERLQGFPDGWAAGLADSARYRMLGNAVAVPVVEWILKRLSQEVLL